MNLHPDDCFVLRGAEGEEIGGDLYLPADRENPPLVLVVHGFKGFKDWGFFPWFGRRLAEAGLAAAIFNLSHNGVGANPETFERLDLFERDTWSKRLFDLGQVMQAASQGLLTDKARPNPGRLGILGHSMGGGLAVLAAARDSRVHSIATLAAICKADRFPPEQVDAQLHAFGHVRVMNARTRQEMRIGREFFEEIRRDPGACDIEAAARELNCPWLLVHGTADESVAFEEAHRLLDCAAENAVAGENAKLLAIEEATHTFGAVHPFAGSTPHLEQAADAVCDHFLRTL